MPRKGAHDIPAARRGATGPALCAALMVTLVSAMLCLPASATEYNSRNRDNPTNKANPWQDDLQSEVGIAEKVNSKIPTDLTFIDEQGSPVQLASFFDGKRPVVINLGYARCPSICIQMRSELTSNLGETGLKLGEDFIILNISIDPKETPQDARATRDEVWAKLKNNGVEPSESGWRFLTADQDTITKLTDAVGYRYLYIPPQDEYGHPGVLVFADGQGTIKRYLSGTAYSPKTLRLSIVETSEGKVGSAWDKVFLTCFVWNEEANNYIATAKFIMMTGGGVTILMVVGLVFAGFAYEKRRRQFAAQNSSDKDKHTPTVGHPDPA